MEIVIRTNSTQSNNVHPLRNAQGSASGKGNSYRRVHMTNSYEKGHLNGHSYIKDSGKIYSCGSAHGYVENENVY